MEKIYAVLGIVLPVIASVLLGALLRKKNVLSDVGAGEIKSLIMSICIPAVMFNTFYAAEITPTVVLLIVIMAVVTVAAWLLGKGARKLTGIDQYMMPQLCTTLEGGMMGNALFILLFGQENLYHFALLDLGNALILFPFLLTGLRMRQSGGSSMRDVVNGLATPVNFAMLGGLLVNFIGLGKVISVSPVGNVLSAVLSFLSAPTGFLILITLGYSLDLSGVRWGETLRTVLARLVIWGGLGVCVCLLVRVLLPQDPLYFYGAVMAFLLPPSFIFSMYGIGEREQTYISATLAVYTLLSLVGFGLLVWVAV